MPKFECPCKVSCWFANRTTTVECPSGGDAESAMKCHVTIQCKSAIKEILDAIIRIALIVCLTIVGCDLAKGIKECPGYMEVKRTCETCLNGLETLTNKVNSLERESRSIRQSVDGCVQRIDELVRATKDGEKRDMTVK